MPIDHNALGTTIALVVDVSKRWVLASSAAMGYTSDAYLDDSRPGGIVVPLSFCAALEWALHGHGRAAQLGLTDEEKTRAVHVLQDTTSAASLRPDTQVQVRSTVTCISPNSAGTYVESLVECSDMASGSLLTATRYGAIFRGVPGPAAELGVRATPPSAPVGADVTVMEIPIDAGFGHVYSECTGIWNPIHTEQVAARAAGLPQTIVHGSALWALAGREIARRYLDGDASRLMSLGARMRKPVLAGTGVRLTMAQAGPGRIHFAIANHLGQLAIEAGVAITAA